jgi:hypothetical protein
VLCVLHGVCVCQLYAFNEGNSESWSPAVRYFINDLKEADASVSRRICCISSTKEKFGTHRIPSFIRTSPHQQNRKDTVSGRATPPPTTTPEGEMKPPKKRKASGRYMGALVADAHNLLMNGGIFGYPAAKEAPGGASRFSC